MLEANFWNERQDAALRTLSEDGTLVELYCTAAPVDVEALAASVRALG